MKDIPGHWAPGRRRALLLGAASAAGLIGGPRAGRAQEARSPAGADWPSRPLRLIIPFPPGGPSDGVGRLVGERISQILGQPVVPENRPGAGSMIGTAAAAQSTDGHTLLLASNSFTVNPSLHQSLPYDPIADFEPIGLISNTPLVIAVPASSPIHSVAELIAAARARPGELTYASAGNGTVNHLAAELFKGRTDVDITNVTYRGDAALMPDLLSGTVSVGFLNLPSTLPVLRPDGLRALAVMSEERLAALPDVPTLAAEGVEGVEVGGMQALLAAAKGLPEGAAQKLEAALVKVLGQPGNRERLTALGALPARADGGRAHLREFLRSQTERWGRVVRERGIRIE